MKNDNLFFLKLGILICLAFAGLRLVKFAYSRVPPYKEGTCLVDMSLQPNLVQFQIEKNHIIEGYSDITVRSIFMEEKIKVSFDAERAETDLATVECEK